MWPKGKQIMIPINSQKYSDQNLDIIKVVAFVQNKLRRPMTQIFFLWLLKSSVLRPQCRRSMLNFEKKGRVVK